MNIFSYINRFLCWSTNKFKDMKVEIILSYKCEMVRIYFSQILNKFFMDIC
jgi:hypothetical protein